MGWGVAERGAVKRELTIPAIKTFMIDRKKAKKDV
jgi:hypothetical protein